MRIHREGYMAITAFATTALAFTAGVVFLQGGGVVLGTAVFAWAGLLFSLYFFRDPERHTPDDASAVISPADGVVVEVMQVDEPDYLKQRVTKVGIFMSPLDVHVNRSPISGTVRHFQYQRGRFLRANLAEAATENEQTIIGVEGENCRVTFRQIAGFVARRICCDLREGHRVQAGERMGMIKFGSRVDVFLPDGVRVKVKEKQRVTAGETILGVIEHAV